jgi:hypothetical protein
MDASRPLEDRGDQATGAFVRRGIPRIASIAK